MWECGLKPQLRMQSYPDQKVTPYVGVWIETRLSVPVFIREIVTPYVGVWIETRSKSETEP